MVELVEVGTAVPLPRPAGWPSEVPLSGLPTGDVMLAGGRSGAVVLLSHGAVGLAPGGAVTVTGLMVLLGGGRPLFLSQTLLVMHVSDQVSPWNFFGDGKIAETYRSPWVDRWCSAAHGLAAADARRWRSRGRGRWR